MSYPRQKPGDGWVYEEKVDGWRLLAYKDGARVRLVSRNGCDHTRRFAGIAAAVGKLGGAGLGARWRGCDLRPAATLTLRLVAKARPGHGRACLNRAIVPPGPRPWKVTR